MNPLAETVIIIAAVALAAAFILRRLIKTLRGKRPSCCSGTKEGRGS
jgi:hypothetical protein